jgi:hypothetical protein
MLPSSAGVDQRKSARLMARWQLRASGRQTAGGYVKGNLILHIATRLQQGSCHSLPFELDELAGYPTVIRRMAFATSDLAHRRRPELTRFTK